MWSTRGVHERSARVKPPALIHGSGWQTVHGPLLQAIPSDQTPRTLGQPTRAVSRWGKPFLWPTRPHASMYPFSISASYLTENREKGYLHAQATKIARRSEEYTLPKAEELSEM
jgi:hypothetical protein